jgi:hypothetical protein
MVALHEYHLFVLKWEREIEKWKMKRIRGGN